MDDMIDVVGCVADIRPQSLRFEAREQEIERPTGRKREQLLR
jgi:hypothetical protein